MSDAAVEPAPEAPSEEAATKSVKPAPKRATTVPQEQAKRPRAAAAEPAPVADEPPPEATLPPLDAQAEQPFDLAAALAEDQAVPTEEEAALAAAFLR